MSLSIAMLSPDVSRLSGSSPLAGAMPTATQSAPQNDFAQTMGIHGRRCDRHRQDR